MNDPQTIVTDWCAAISARDKARFLDLSHAAIAFYGPDGVGIGHEVVSDWFDAEPMRITIKKIDADGLVVRVNHHIDWIAPDGSVSHALDNAAQIEIRDDKVYSYRRMDPEGDRPVSNPVVSP